MIPGFEKRNRHMEQASLEELMPGFDKEQEWQRLHDRLRSGAKRKQAPVWAYAAALLLLVACTVMVLFRRPAGSVAVRTPVVQPPVAIAPSPGSPGAAALPAGSMHKDSAAQKNSHVLADKKIKTASPPQDIPGYVTKADVVRNGTPCPIRICISQTVKCPDHRPSTINSCSTLEPEQSAKLSYGTSDKLAKNCSLTLGEIEIKSIATGEMILLNASSTPSTAQDVFSYITRQRKGDISAGVFNSDCSNDKQKHDLRLNNVYDNLIIE